MSSSSSLPSSAIKLLKEVKCFGGSVKQYSHESLVNKCTMQFCVYLPPVVAAAAHSTVPVVYYLAGLTCNEEVGMIKGGMQRMAAAQGLAIVTPDTSPRGITPPIAGQDTSYDFGTGAGFYLDAVTENWTHHYNMDSYVTHELPSVIATHFRDSIDGTQQSIMGHSMGGHGALTLALKNPGLYKSVSAFAPIVNPIRCPWGIKAFTGYLGEENNKDNIRWKEYDATELLREHGKFDNLPILIDQGTDDQFYHEKQLLTEHFEQVCKEVGQQHCTINMREGYDHSYYFISTFMENHMLHHAEALLKK